MIDTLHSCGANGEDGQWARIRKQEINTGGKMCNDADMEERYDTLKKLTPSHLYPPFKETGHDRSSEK